MNPLTFDQLALQRLYFWEKTAPGRIALTQPMGGGVIQDFTWAQVGDQVRRMAAHLQSAGLGTRCQGGHFVQELRLVADERPGDLDGRLRVGAAVSHARA